MSQLVPTPETNEVVTRFLGMHDIDDAQKFRGTARLARELERQRDAAREDARRLAETLNKLMQCADPNIDNCSDAELQEAAEHGFSREIIEQAEAFLKARSALAAHEALTAKN